MRRWKKYLAVSRTGKKVAFPFLLIGARDPGAPVALAAYAEFWRKEGIRRTIMSNGMEIARYADDLFKRVPEFEAYLATHGTSEPWADEEKVQNEDADTVAAIEGPADASRLPSERDAFNLVMEALQSGDYGLELSGKFMSFVKLVQEGIRVGIVQQEPAADTPKDNPRFAGLDVRE